MGCQLRKCFGTRFLVLTSGTAFGFLVEDVHAVVMEDVVSADPHFGHLSDFDQVDAEPLRDRSDGHGLPVVVVLVAADVVWVELVVRDDA